MKKGRILITKQIADRMGCSPETVRRWYREGKLAKAFKVGGPTSPIKMHASDLERLASGRAVQKETI